MVLPVALLNLLQQWGHYRSKSPSSIAYLFQMDVYTHLTSVQPLLLNIRINFTEQKENGQLGYYIHDKPTYLWDCRENSTLTIWRYLFCQFPNKNKCNKNECGHNLVTRSQTIRPHLHHEWQGLDAITPQWDHLPTVGVDKMQNNLLRISGKHSPKNNCISRFCHIPEEQEDPVIMSAGTQETQLIKKYNCILIQAATRLRGFISF